jgi:hypothetical protein
MEQSTGRGAPAGSATPNSFSATVAEEMGNLLVRRPLDPDEDFFLSGGDSLRAVELIARLAGRFQPDDPGKSEQLHAALLLAVFDDPTPIWLGEVIGQHVQ